VVCHTRVSGGVLGVKTRQMNRDFVGENQILAWLRNGLLDPHGQVMDVEHLQRLARADDVTRSVEDRARSYLDVNCAQCHRPGGTVAYFDARYDTPLSRQGLLEGQVLIDEGIDGARAIAPNDRWRSIVFVRMNTL